MSKLLQVLGWLLVIPGGLFLLLAPFAAMDSNSSAAIGLVALGVLSGGPGLALLISGRRSTRSNELQTQMIGFVRTRDAFAIQELAAHIGKTPAEAQTLLLADIARYRLPLVMHRASGRYLRLDRLSRAAQVADRCQGCGGDLGNQIVFEGEQMTCPYCSSVVVTHAPAPAQQGWGQAQGAWAPPSPVYPGAAQSPGSWGPR